MRMIKVNYRDKETKDFLEDTTLLEMSDSFKKYYNYPILVAKVDNDITPLAEKVTKKCDIRVPATNIWTTVTTAIIKVALK